MDTALDIVRTLAILIGVTIAVITFTANTKQKRLENSIRLVDMFFQRVSEQQLRWFKASFRGTAEHANVPEDMVRLPLSLSGVIREEDLTDEEADSRADAVHPISSLFSEGSPDQGASAHICNVLEIVAYETVRGSAEPRYVYYRLGQIIDHYAEIIVAVGINRPFGYPNVAKLSKKWRNKSKKWPQEVHVTIE